MQIFICIITVTLRGRTSLARRAGQLDNAWSPRQWVDRSCDVWRLLVCRWAAVGIWGYAIDLNKSCQLLFFAPRLLFFAIAFQNCWSVYLIWLFIMMFVSWLDAAQVWSQLFWGGWPTSLCWILVRMRSVVSNQSNASTFGFILITSVA